MSSTDSPSKRACTAEAVSPSKSLGVAKPTPAACALKILTDERRAQVEEEVACDFHRKWRSVTKEDEGADATRWKDAKDSSDAPYTSLAAFLEAYPGINPAHVKMSDAGFVQVNILEEDDIKVFPPNLKGLNTKAAKEAIATVQAVYALPELSASEKRWKAGDIVHRNWLKGNAWQIGKFNSGVAAVQKGDDKEGAIATFLASEEGKSFDRSFRHFDADVLAEYTAEPLPADASEYLQFILVPGGVLSDAERQKDYDLVDLTVAAIGIQ